MINPLRMLTLSKYHKENPREKCLICKRSDNIFSVTLRFLTERIYEYRNYNIKVLHYCENHIHEVSKYSSETIVFSEHEQEWYHTRMVSKCKNKNCTDYLEPESGEYCRKCIDAIIKIQRWWYYLYWVPTSRVRIKIINREFDEYYNHYP